MNKKKEIEIVKKNYNNNPQLEWDRLEGFTYEFEITKKFLLKHLKGKTVLDIGGGPGRYSIFLAKQGYEVTLIDLSSGNINLAKQKISENNLNIKTYETDARDLSKLNLGKFDNVLVMGPLYHLSKDDDRIKCINEAKKHLAKNGKIFVASLFNNHPISAFKGKSEILYDHQNKGLYNLVRHGRRYRVFRRPDAYQIRKVGAQDDPYRGHIRRYGA